MLKRFHTSRLGFTLTEITIVLAMAGLLLGAIWATASTVLQNSNANHAVQQVIQTVQNIRDRYTDVASTQNPPNWAVGANLTGTLNSLLLFPTDMTQTSTVTHAMNGSFQVVQPGCGGAPATPNNIQLPGSVCPATPNNLIYFRIILNGLTQTYCMKTLAALPVSDPAMGIVQVGVTNSNGCTGMSCVQACANTPTPPCIFTSPVPVTTASGWCDGTAQDNVVFVDFKLHN